MIALATAAQDSTTMIGRELKHTLRYPLMLVASILVPVVLLLLFVYILGGPIGNGLGEAARGACRARKLRRPHWSSVAARTVTSPGRVTGHSDVQCPKGMDGLTSPTCAISADRLLSGGARILADETVEPLPTHDLAAIRDRLGLGRAEAQAR